MWLAPHKIFIKTSTLERVYKATMNNLIREFVNTIFYSIYSNYLAQEYFTRFSTSTPIKQLMQQSHLTNTLRLQPIRTNNMRTHST